MYLYDDELLSRTFADSITEVSHGIVYVLCAGVLLMPIVLLFGLLYVGIRDRRRLRSANEVAPAPHSSSEANSDRVDQRCAGETP